MQHLATVLTGDPPGERGFDLMHLLPPKQELDDLNPSDVVKVSNHTERFWVQVIERTGNTFIGRIDNALLFSDYTAGDLISFGAENIYDIAHE